MESVIIVFSMEKEIKKQEPLFTILHFNDAYDIQPNQKGLGGVVNFYEQIKTLRQKHKNSILLFSGDCFSPSSLSNHYKGSQMVEALKIFNINVACYGNHQFDFGRARCTQLSMDCNFKWLLGNIKDYLKKDKLTEKKNGKNGKNDENIPNIGNALEYQIIQIAGYKLGIFGIASQEWLHIIGGEYEQCLEYINIGEHSNKMCKLLRQKNCNFIIALTHMRIKQDLQLPTLCSDIDIILGGHDHEGYIEIVNNIPILKSGQNFKSIGVVQVHKKHKKFTQTKNYSKLDTDLQSFNYINNLKGKNFDFIIDLHTVKTAHQQNIQLKNKVNGCLSNQLINDRIIGHTQVDLDMKFMRTKQTNYGNFLADLTNTYFYPKCDVVAINSGTVRTSLIPKGRIKCSDLQKIKNEQIGMRIVTGQILLKMLQNSISQLPRESGRFLFVSGIKFSYKLSKQKNQKNKIQQVYVGSKLLDLNKTYRLVSRQYLFSGKDGYDMLKNLPSVPVQSRTILDILIQFFESGIRKGLQKQSSVCQAPNNLLKLTKSPSFGSNQPIITLKRQITPATVRFKSLATEWRDIDTITYYSINPKIDGRIKQLF